MRRALTSVLSVLWILCLVLAGCGGDGGGDGDADADTDADTDTDTDCEKGGMDLVQPYNYMEKGDCTGVSGLPESGAVGAFAGCQCDRFTFGDGTFRFPDSTGDGTWDENPTCAATYGAGSIECVVGANYSFSFDCEGCQGTVMVGTP